MENICSHEELPTSQIFVIIRVPVAGGVTVVLPSGQVTATAQADCDWA
jgi:hypothetical protein